MADDPYKKYGIKIEEYARKIISPSGARTAVKSGPRTVRFTVLALKGIAEADGMTFLARALAHPETKVVLPHSSLTLYCTKPPFVIMQRFQRFAQSLTISSLGVHMTGDYDRDYQRKRIVLDALRGLALNVTHSNADFHCWDELVAASGFPPDQCQPYIVFAGNPVLKMDCAPPDRDETMDEFGFEATLGIAIAEGAIPIFRTSDPTEDMDMNITDAECQALFDLANAQLELPGNATAENVKAVAILADMLGYTGYEAVMMPLAASDA